MAYLSIRQVLPKFLLAPLFGDRDRFGLAKRMDDPDWISWQEDIYQRFYDQNQRSSAGLIVNDAGYEVMSNLDISGKSILEIGPGDIRHIKHWQGIPGRYVIADVQSQMLERASLKLDSHRIPVEKVLVRYGDIDLPFANNEFDIIVSFYSLEHLYPFETYLSEFLRVLKPQGMLVGAIPNEGGLAWGLGRYFTSRRWFKKNTNVDPDKIICWEHPNFADFLLSCLDREMICSHQSFWPLRIPNIDINLVTRFIYAKK